ncbi:uncharacterized protein B0H64DRAFT_438408 [Chaetomium fimeti]|uniref:Uncharacterized protein n=1 Tax=Chaetomium fimeti TaxID=1854472 RepID=A0AAE0LYG4_9PEZI|nr:hypothetical protein B0H64DRAFT_438408 [Chaetomium fimeti]
MGAEQCLPRSFEGTPSASRCHITAACNPLAAFSTKSQPSITCLCQSPSTITPPIISTTMPSHVATPIAAPIPIPAPRRNLGLITTQELFASLNATLASKMDELVTPIHHIRESDYSVPAPPPPSPVSFRDHWPASMRR